jgi:hypothetical protein
MCGARPGGAAGILVLAGAATLLAACSIDGSTPGVRDRCASAGGLGTCDLTPVDDPESACWRLVECGVIPVANPDDEPDCCFDWATCVNFIEDLPDDRYDFTLPCVEAATCDELRFRGSPDRPSRSREDMPECLQHGDQ